MSHDSFTNETYPSSPSLGFMTFFTAAALAVGVGGAEKFGRFAGWLFLHSPPRMGDIRYLGMQCGNHASRLWNRRPPLICHQLLCGGMIGISCQKVALPHHSN